MNSLVKTRKDDFPKRCLVFIVITDILTRETFTIIHNSSIIPPCPSPELKQKAVQTELLVSEFGVGTDPDWESQVGAVFERSSQLADQYDQLMKKQAEEEEAEEQHRQHLQRKMEEATQQHQVSPPHLQDPP